MTKWKSPRADHVAVAAAARETPGEWTPVSVYPARMTADGIANQIRTGVIVAYRPAGAFDAYTATVDDGRAVWTRYVEGLAKGDAPPHSDLIETPGGAL